MSGNKKDFAVAYLRARGGAPRENIDRQHQACEFWAASLGLSLQAVYADCGGAGSVDGRSGLAQMLDDARRGKFGTVVVQECDRLSRDMGDLYRILVHLAGCGVAVHQVGRGRLGLGDVSVQGLMGREGRDLMRQRIRSGQERSARRGLVPSSCCFGYATVPGEPGRRTVVAEQAMVVREIFDMRVGGATEVRIAMVLNARMAAGRAWTAEGVGRVLRNRLYAGELVWGRHATAGDRVTGRSRRVACPRDEWTVVSVEHLRIVTQEAWDAVQALLERAPSPARRNGRPATPSR